MHANATTMVRTLAGLVLGSAVVLLGCGDDGRDVSSGGGGTGGRSDAGAETGGTTGAGSGTGGRTGTGGPGGATGAGSGGSSTAGHGGTGGSGGAGGTGGSGGNPGGDDGGIETCSLTGADCAICEREKCCNELVACEDDTDCDCLADCVGMSGLSDKASCMTSCSLDADPSGWSALEGCLSAGCPDSDECP